MEEVALSRTFGEDAGRWFQEQLESHGVDFHGGEELEAFEGDGRVRAVRHQERPRRSSATRSSSAPGCGPTRCWPQRAGLEVEDGDRLRLEAADLGRGHLRGRRLLLLRQRRPRPAAAGRALGRGDAAGHPRRPQHARRGRDYEVVPYFFSDLADWAEPRVRRAGAGLGRGDLARRPRGRRVLGLVPEGRPGRRRPQRRALRRPRRGSPPARRRRRRLRLPEACIADADSDLAALA